MGTRQRFGQRCWTRGPKELRCYSSERLYLRLQEHLKVARTHWFPADEELALKLACCFLEIEINEETKRAVEIQADKEDEETRGKAAFYRAKRLYASSRLWLEKMCADAVGFAESKAWPKPTGTHEIWRQPDESNTIKGEVIPTHIVNYFITHPKLASF